jgi:hypothetical protein
VSAGSRHAGHPRNVPAGTVHDKELIVLDHGDDEVESDEDEAVEEEAAVSADAGETDSGQSVHDDSVVKTLRGRAIHTMKDEGIEIEKDEEKMA